MTVNESRQPSLRKLIKQYYKEDGRLESKAFARFALKHRDFRRKDLMIIEQFVHFIHTAAIIDPKGRLSEHIEAATTYYMETASRDRAELIASLLGPPPKPKTRGAANADDRGGVEAVKALPEALRSLIDTDKDDTDEPSAEAGESVEDIGMTAESVDEPESTTSERRSAARELIDGTFEKDESGGPDILRARFVSPRAMLMCRFVWEELHRQGHDGRDVLGKLVERIDAQLVAAWSSDSPPDDPFSVDVVFDVAWGDFSLFNAYGIYLAYAKMSQPGFDERLEAWFSGWSASLSERVPRKESRP